MRFVNSGEVGTFLFHRAVIPVHPQRHGAFDARSLTRFLGVKSPPGWLGVAVGFDCGRGIILSIGYFVGTIVELQQTVKAISRGSYSKVMPQVSTCCSV
jgi:hypothetical protein